MLDAFTSLHSGFVCLPQADIDTDQICPARFMTTVSTDGLAEALFHDARYDIEGMPVSSHPLTNCDVAAQKVLVGGANFGSGSSREHAIWAIREFGFKAILAPRLADIFRANALNNGLLAVEIPEIYFEWLIPNKAAEIHIDLVSQTIATEGYGSTSFDIDPFAKLCLLNGVDRLGYLLSALPEIGQYETRMAGGSRA
ncbi:MULTISPECIES: 3-isopropylmalate dehydratase small subunit [unclassified Sphingobium]|uniref:3-isopropylmalate dehydratase small subunit n=1 Tax=unclassified Sphingobium TaxID=2611147 RepID=UPI000D1732D9|nr:MULTISPECIES: 3-isopropylmalate dehydratase small subunit [unclassified Sphingobium]MBG6116377.1 3-isopropylmalate/(R)-2-methylmalate dehydratase small subunit [Sphingobium sp. JAI105]PSO09881.1 3-isopropylmalate dehydratase small subunit [Sphingobium sp. AEW4]TWC95919.1 3-isopropylmalate/(R)-2-methylmalate dehydratase small subunit [Sphingobium sp. AEW010]TWD15123.1 3-isopropylmalate/(R)-2-methylmalate dehydratase small subunit [Sphingobium sp. AEW013]TWD19074.1 3-isopropylmalate/(R)-2-met